MRTIRTSVFETNSSSIHVLSICKESVYNDFFDTDACPLPAWRPAPRRSPFPPPSVVVCGGGRVPGNAMKFTLITKS